MLSLISAFQRCIALQEATSGFWSKNPNVRQIGPHAQPHSARGTKQHPTPPAFTNTLDLSSFLFKWTVAMAGTKKPFKDMFSMHFWLILEHRASSFWVEPAEISLKMLERGADGRPFGPHSKYFLKWRGSKKSPSSMPSGCVSMLRVSVRIEC